MRKLCLPLLVGLLMLVATRVSAAISLSTISGQVFKADGTADANDVIWFTPNPPTQTVAGGQVTAQAVATTTDANGNLAPISLAQGITVNITLLNGATGPVTGCVPVTATSTFISVISCTNVSAFTGITLNSLAAPTANYSLAGFGLTNVGSLVGGSGLMSVTGGAGGIAIKGTTTTNLDTLTHMSVNGVYNVQEYGADITGAADSSVAEIAAYAAACNAGGSASAASVYFPPGTYKAITYPFTFQCKNPMDVYGAGANSTTLTNGMSGGAGPTIIVAGSGQFSTTGPVGDLGGVSALVKGPLVGSTGNSFAFTNDGSNVNNWFRLADLVPTSSAAVGPLNGLSAFSVQFWVRPSTTGVAQTFTASDGGADFAAGNGARATYNENCVSAPEGVGLPSTCSGAYFVGKGTDNKVYARINTGGTQKRINSGSTTLDTTAHLLKLTYDGSNVRLIVDGVLRGTTAATGTVRQRDDENWTMGISMMQWPYFATSGDIGFNGQIDSFDIEKAATDTCGGSTTLGASCTANPSSKFSGGANTVILLNFDQNVLPTVSGLALPFVEADNVNGTTITGTTTAYLGLYEQLTGCCGAPLNFHDLSVSGGSFGLVNEIGVVNLHDFTDTVNAFGNGLWMGQNGTFNSVISTANFSNGIMPLAPIGGITTIYNTHVTCQGLCLATGAGRLDHLYILPSSATQWGILHGMNAGQLLESDVQFDVENGGTFAADVEVGGSATIVGGNLQSSNDPPYRVEGNGAIGWQIIGGQTTGNPPSPQNYIFDVTGASDFSGLNSGGLISVNGLTFSSGTNRNTDPAAGTNWLPAQDTNGNTPNPVINLAAGSAQAVNQFPRLQMNGTLYGGVKANGSIATAALSTPSAPTVTVAGTTGATSYTYFCQAFDVNGNSLAASTGTTVTNGNASLSATNYNIVTCGPQLGVASWNVLKTNTSTGTEPGAFAGASGPYNTGDMIVLLDQGAGTYAVTPPTRNSTADLASAGNISATSGGVIVSNGGTAPTITAGCNGAGVVQPASPSTNVAGHFTVQTSATTTCTLTFATGTPFAAAPECQFFDESASTTPSAMSTGACGTATCVVDFASRGAFQIGYMCIGH